MILGMILVYYFICMILGMILVYYFICMILGICSFYFNWDAFLESGIYDCGWEFVFSLIFTISECTSRRDF